MTAHSDPRPAADQDLSRAWQLLMGLVLDQRMHWSEVAATLGISQAGLRALLAIDPEHPQPQRELAKVLNCDPSYVTAMVDELERVGFATRQVNPADRRLKTVALTTTGAAALGTARDGLFSPPAQLTRLSTQDQRDLARLLREAIHGPTPHPPQR